MSARPTIFGVGLHLISKGHVVSTRNYLPLVFARMSQ
jgi:hypothetical protein